MLELLIYPMSFIVALALLIAVHEFGHFFSLFHTHGNPQAGTAKELVTRHKDLRNCDNAGDVPLIR